MALNDHTADCIGTLKTPSGVSDDVTDSAPRQYTYADLVAYFEQTEGTALKPQQQKNRLSALNQFLQSRDLTLTDAIGAELKAGFPQSIASFIERGREEGLQEGTLNNRKTAMRQWSDTYTLMLGSSDSPIFEAFYQALEYYFLKGIEKGIFKNKTQASLMFFGHICYIRNTIRTKKRCFFNDTLSRVNDFESSVGAPQGSLTKFIYAPLIEKSKVNKNRTSYGEKIKNLQEHPYMLDAFPEQLQKEIASFVKFKTAPSPHPLNRNEPWLLKGKEEFRLSEKEWNIVSPDGKKFSPTAINFMKRMQSFFGALKKLDYDSEKFSLAYLTDFSLLVEYVDFMSSRHEQITKTPIMVLHISLSLMLKMEKHGRERVFGFVRQKPEYASKLINPVPESEWDVWCHDRVLDIKQFIGDLEEGLQIKDGRDVEEAAKQYLERQHPITALFELAENMRNYLEVNKNILKEFQKILLYRDLLIIEMFPTQPLRIKMLAIMTYKSNNNGHLYKMQSGGWAVRFKAHEFKNETGAAADKDYDIPLEPTLWPKVENYLFNVRPLFKESSDRVFVAPGHGSDTQKEKKKNGWSYAAALSRSFVTRTKQFLIGCLGFGPHTVRHIVATDYIKNNPNGYQIAADILHDRLDTVLKNYAHLKAKDGHKYYQDWLSGVRSEWRKTV